MINERIHRRDFIRISSAFLASSAALSPVLATAANSSGDLSRAPGEEKVKTICELCFWRCGIEATVSQGRVTKLVGQKEHPLSNGKLCPRGTGGTGMLYDPDRLRHPLIRVTEGGKQSFRKASWDEALGLVAQKLGQVKEEHGASSMAFFSHGFGASFFKSLLSAYGVGCFTAPSYAQCRGPRTEAFVHTFGHAMGSPENIDVRYSKYLVLIGSHLGENMHNTAIQDFSQALANGCKLVVVDPRYSTAAGKAEHWLPIRPGTDLALLRAWIRILLDEKIYDRDFISKNAIGLEQLWEGVKDATVEQTFAITGIPAETILAVGRDLGRYGNAALIHPGRHVTWYGDDTQRERAIAILNALVGNYRMPGGIINQSGFALPKVKGKEFPKGEKYHSRFPLASAVPANEVVDATREGKFKAWFIYGTNLIHSLGDQKGTLEALQKLDFMVAVDVLPMEITGYADVVLPECTYLERYDDLDNRSFREPYLAIRQPVVPPLYESKPGHEIAKLLAQKMGLEGLFPWSMEEYLNQRLAPLGLTLAELKEKGTIKKDDPHLYRQPGEQLTFATPSGKIELASSVLAKAGFDAVPQYTRHPEAKPGYFRLLYGRAPMHTFGRTANNRMLGELMPENELWVNRVAGLDMKLKNGEMIYLINQEGVKSRTPIKVRLTERIRPDAVYMVHGFGHTDARLNQAKGRGASDADLITHLSVDPIMGGTGMNNNFVTFTREA